MSALREITNQVADRKVELKSQWKGKHVVFDEEGHSREVVKQVEEENKVDESLEQIPLDSSLEVETSGVQDELEDEVVDEREADKENKEELLYREPRKPNFKFEGKHKVFVDEEELLRDQEEVTPTKEVEFVTEGLQNLSTGRKD